MLLVDMHEHILGAFANFRKRLLASSCLYVRIDEFIWNFIFEEFSKICRRNPSLIKI
jgi:hypothetical protein